MEFERAHKDFETQRQDGRFPPIVDLILTKFSSDTSGNLEELGLGVFMWRCFFVEPGTSLFLQDLTLTFLSY